MDKILFNEEINQEISSLSKSAKKSINIYSAFVKTNALEWISNDIDDGIEVNIICRWQANDLIAQVSDLNAYEYCKKKGWKFGIDQNLHSKAFIFDERDVILGSANLTDKGLSLTKKGNIELGTIVTPGPVDLKRLKNMMSDIFWMDDKTYDVLKKFLESHEKPKKELKWPDEIKNIIQKPINHLWVNELFYTPAPPNGSLKEFTHDLDLLGDIDGSNFSDSRFYKWFKEQLARDYDGYKNFGWITEQLHKSLLDQPPPYRSDIKFYVQNLISWIEFLEIDEIKMKKFQRTNEFSLV